MEQSGAEELSPLGDDLSGGRTVVRRRRIAERGYFRNFCFGLVNGVCSLSYYMCEAMTLEKGVFPFQ